MKYADSNSSLERFGEVQKLIKALLSTRGIRNKSEDEYNECPRVTDSIKYTTESKITPNPQGLSGEHDDIHDIGSIFDFDPMPYQIESWKTLLKHHRDRLTEDTNQAALITAPTGMGKTEAFLGPIFKQLFEGETDTVALVYPRNTLVEDQLARVLEYVHRINSHINGSQPLSVGLWNGKIPKTAPGNDNKDLFNHHNGHFKLTSCWCDRGNQHYFEYDPGANPYGIQCQNGGPAFTADELTLHRKKISSDTPDILLTTLESLEQISLRPHEDTIESIDTIVFDEVHLYNGSRGAHAARVIDNLTDVRSDCGAGATQLIGASATVDNPKRFVEKLFSFADPASVETVQARAKSEQISEERPHDYEDDDGTKHYYFLLSPRGNSPGVATMSLHQTMMLGHTMLKRRDPESEKMLSFINSRSTVTKRHGQFTDADTGDSPHEPGLYERHRTAQPTGKLWAEVGDQYGDGFSVDDPPLAVASGHGESPLRRHEILQADLLFSTSYMEVGIDIPEIKIVSQYRTPFKISSFTQRVGRAGRDEGIDPHIVTFLSQDNTVDANLFYRAGRFLEDDVTTPLNPDNEIIEEIHGYLYSYYSRMQEVQREGGVKNEERRFLQRFLNDDKIGLSAFYQFLLNPQDVLSEMVDEPASDILDKMAIQDMQNQLHSREQQIASDIEPTTAEINIDLSELLLQEDSEQEAGRVLHDQIIQQVQTLQNKYKDIGVFLGPDSDRLQRLRDDTAVVEEWLKKMTPGDTSMYERVKIKLDVIKDKIKNIVDGENAFLDPEPIKLVESIQELLESADKIRPLSHERVNIFYLKRTLEELKEYTSKANAHHYPYRIKSLLRAGYYFTQFRSRGTDAATTQTELDVSESDGPAQPQSEIQYMPNKYFDNSGPSFEIEQDKIKDVEDTAPQTSLITKYVPLRFHHHEDDKLLAFAPRVNPDADSKVFDFSSVDGTTTRGVRVPSRIEPRVVEDKSKAQTEGIVKYCPECYRLPSKSDPRKHCRNHKETVKYKYGNLYSEPIISSTLIDADNPNGRIECIDLSARIRIEGVDLEIREYHRQGESGWQKGHKNSHRIHSGDPSLGFTVNTRGIVWDITDLIERVEETIDNAALNRYKESRDDAGTAELIAHTAAHYLLLLVSDVSGLAQDSLLYAVEHDPDEGIIKAAVFEQTEGGQGFTDLLAETLDDSPEKVLTALTRVGFNSQLENQRLWRDDGFRDAVFDIDPGAADKNSKHAVKEAIKQYHDETHLFEVDSEDGSVLDSLAEEVIATIDRINTLASTETEETDSSDSLELARDELFELKSEIVRQQFDNGVTDQEAVAQYINSKYDLDSESVDMIQRLLISPDVDGCIDNLHLQNCNADVDQEDAVSYLALTEIRRHLISTVDSEDDPSTSAEDDRYTASLDDGTEYNLIF